MSELREHRSRTRYDSCVTERERSRERVRSRDDSRDSGGARSGENSERVRRTSVRGDSRESSQDSRGSSRDSRGSSRDSRGRSKKRSRKGKETKNHGRADRRRSERRSRDRSSRRERRGRSRESSRRRSRSPSASRRSSTRESATVEALLQTVQKLQEELCNARYKLAAQEHLVPQFDPADDKADIEIWVRDVDRIARRGSWRDDDIMCYIARQLRGHARQFFDEEQRRDPTWEMLKTALVARFRKPLPFNRLFRDAANYTAQPGQKLGDYCFNKLTKLRALKVDIPDEFLRDAVIGSIGDETIERTIRSNKYASADELYVAMREMGVMPKSEGVSAAKASRVAERTPISVAGPSGVRAADRKKQPGDQSKHMTKFVCFNCGEEGHVARTCSKPRRKCMRCQKDGHQERFCYRTKVAVNVVQVSPNDNKWVMHARVNGRRVQCLLDTGSARTLISKAVAIRLGIKMVEGPLIQLRGYGSLGSCNRLRAEVTIQVMEAIADVTAIIVETEAMIYQVIVGQDFIGQDHVILIKIRDRIIVKELSSVGVEPQSLIDAYATEAVFDLSALDCDEMSEEERIGCIRVIEEYRDRVTTSMRSLGKTSLVKMDIKCTTDVPVVYRPYRMAEVERVAAREIVEELLENGIIQESISPYASPITLVKKKTGEYRLCVDYRRLNAVTIRDQYPLPLIEDQIDRLGGYWYFTAIDLAAGYYQVAMSEEAIPKTAFVTPDGHYECGIR
nr:PREDICTED: uncharacterized protein LOC105663172 [Megachile rotundata]